MIFGHHHHGHHHGHGHDHHDHDDDSGHGSGHGQDRRRQGLLARYGRFAVAFVIVAAAVASACIVLVSPGDAVVVTRFGDPIHVLTAPGVAWKMPAPFESTIDVDLRLRTTSSGLQDVGTRDGLRILVQAYVAWQVPAEADHIRQFLRAVRNQPDVAAQQLRSFVGSSLEITTASFDLADLINTNPAQVQLATLESRLRERLDEQALKVYGVTVRQVGIERLTLPAETLNATIARMRAERETVAAERQAEGRRAAAEIASNADRDARVLRAKAKQDASEVEAKSRLEAADIYGQAYSSAPELYNLLRSLDTLDTVVGDNTRLILRTDAAPFRVLVDGPPNAATPAPQPAQGSRQ
ncbi:protease modulator HflC [Bradyrhizobium commune]|uniref:Protein HflC n=1 Tax=Bradyrhizobium commune TaxID=83627 RepID=A0A7S9GY76_9BRAD|nr:protease modulator HflC [Bradyrhizobium commune]QPF90630.1 protease modulator HflC [Bradyrhizobium commune]